MTLRQGGTRRLIASLASGSGTRGTSSGVVPLRIDYERPWSIDKIRCHWNPNSTFNHRWFIEPRVVGERPCMEESGGWRIFYLDISSCGKSKKKREPMDGNGWEWMGMDGNGWMNAIKCITPHRLVVTRLLLHPVWLSIAANWLKSRRWDRGELPRGARPRGRTSSPDASLFFPPTFRPISFNSIQSCNCFGRSQF